MDEAEQTSIGKSLEVSGPGGTGIRAKGYRLADLAWPLLVIGVGYCALTLFNHTADAKDNGKEVAQALKDSNREVAQALKDSNLAVAEAMKQMAKEQQRANEIGREQTCLLTLPPDRRTNAGDFCKRLSRERDR